MLKIRTRARIPLLCALLLTGCATTPVVTEAPRLAIPETLKTCPPQPVPPPAAADDRDLATWIVDLAGAGQTCRSNLSSVMKVLAQ